MSRRSIVTIVAALACTAILAGCGSSQPSEEVKLGGIALTEVLDGLINRTTHTLRGITDGPSAEAAKQELVAINEDWDDLAYHVPKLPTEGKLELAKHAEKRLPEVDQLRAMVHRSPQLSAILGDEMDAMMEKIAGLMSPTAGEDLQ